MDGLNLNQTEKEKILESVKYSKNVCILIDYDNLFYTFKRYSIDVTDDSYNIGKFFNLLYGMDKIRSFRAYADFEQVAVSLRNLQEQRIQIRNVYGNNRNDQFRKNASDIELSMDAIEMTHRESNIDTYVIVTSDSDMIPVMSRLKYKGKTVHLFYASENSSQVTHFESYCDISCDLIKLFNVNTAVGSPNYWYQTVIDIVNNWHNDEKNKKYTLGFNWLKKQIVSTCHVSEFYAAEIINDMFQNKLLQKLPVPNSNDCNIIVVDENSKNS